jgi:UDP-N-acetylglucosamine 1-carboxyvinyltransferase
MHKFDVEGGFPISGEVSLLGGKNSVIPVICATLLTDETCIINDVPRISDVRDILSILKLLGSQIKYITPSQIQINNKNLEFKKKDERVIFEKITKLRGSILLLAPFIFRFHNTPFVFPGGDRIGGRELSPHFSGFKKLGLNVEYINEHFNVSGNLKNNYIFLYESSVTATENLAMLCSTIEGESFIENAACEPHVRDLCNMLVKMGAEIEGIGTNILKIKGKNNLSPVTHTVLSDTIEAATYLIFGLMSKGKIRVKNVKVEDMKSILYVFDIFNIQYKVYNDSIEVSEIQDMYYRKELGFNNMGIYTQPYPAFPTDLLPQAITLATQVKGDIIFFEKMYEGRIDFAEDLVKMGGKFIFLDTHRILVKGVSKLKGASLIGKDIRSAVSYLSAMISAQGKSSLLGVEHIDRAYPKIEVLLSNLGAKIKRYKI